MRGTIHTWVIFFKENLKISNTCQQTREGLLAQITNCEMFSHELAQHFTGENKTIPYKITPTDPIQVAVLKKIINAIQTLEQISGEIEALDMGPERYTAAITADAVKMGYNAVHSFYGALQLLNHSSADVQRIVGPHMAFLSEKMGIAATGLEQFTQHHIEQGTGAALMSAVQMLPTKTRDDKESFALVSHVIYELPHYFSQLQALISSNSSMMIPNPHRSGADYTASVAQKKRDMAASLEQLTNATGVSLGMKNVAILSKLARHSTDLLRTAAPLSQQAYLESTRILGLIRDQIVQLHIELERTEEDLGLKAGFLVERVMPKVEDYYTQFATYASSFDTYGKWGSVGDVLKMAVTEKVLGAISVPETPQILILKNTNYRQELDDNRHDRLREAHLAANDTTTESAAHRFFDKLATYSTWFYTNLGSIDPSEKDSLTTEYRQFQRHLAAIYPDIDQLIVLTLNLKPGEQMPPNSHKYQGLWATNHFIAVNGCKDRVIADIQQSRAQAQFKATLVQNTIRHAGGTIPVLTNATVSSAKHDASPLVVMGAAIEKKTMFGQINELKLSKGMDDFIRSKFLPYLKDNLSDVVLAPLSLDTLSLTAATPPYSDFYQDAQGVVVYKRLVNSFYRLKSGLEKLEQLNDYNDVSDIVHRVQFFKTIKALAGDLQSAKLDLVQTAYNSELNALINDSIDLLKPLRSIPMVGDYLAMSEQRPTAVSDQTNVIDARLAEQVRDETAGHLVKEVEKTPPDFLLLIAEQLYKIPGKIHQLRPDSIDKIKPESEEELTAKVNSFMQSIAGLSIKNEVLQDLLNVIVQLDHQIAQMGMEGQGLLISRLRDVRSKLGAELLVAADNAEFHLSFKPDSISAEIERRFNAFYDALMTHLPLDEEQRFKSMMDDGVTERRIDHEKERLLSINACNLMPSLEDSYKTNDLQKKLCEERIAYLEQKREKEQLKESLWVSQKYQAFKDEMLYACLRASVKHHVDEPGDLSEAFCHLVAQDNMDKYQERTKEIIVDRLDHVDGIRLEFNKKIALDKPSLTTEHQTIKQRCIQLNQSLQCVNQELVKINSIHVKSNPLMAEKKAFLEYYKEILCPSGVSDREHGAAILRGMIEKGPDLVTIQKKIEAGIQHFNTFIKTYDDLEQMKQWVHNKNKGKDPTVNPPLTEIKALQACLKNEDVLPEQRLAQVKNRLNQRECSNNMLENADNSIKTLFSKLLSRFGVESDYSKKFKSFKQTLCALKEEEKKTGEHSLQASPQQEGFARFFNLKK